MARCRSIFVHPLESMNTTTIIIGTAVFLFGLYTAILRILRPQQISKLAALQELFGYETGNLVYVLIYSVLPLVAGAIFAFAGVRGVSLFG